MTKPNFGKLSLFTLLLSAAFLLNQPAAAAAADDWTPEFRPELHIQKAAGDIKIDGLLDDPGWIRAGRARNFVEHNPGDQTRPPVETVALITYDENNLYVAMICYDDPATIRASYCERDRIFQDDYIVLALDTYDNAVWAYELSVNPYGIQGDLLWSQNGMEDEGFDLVYESAATITDSGYQVEMAVPFRSLRFPDSPTQTWRVDFWRNHPRDSRRQYSWAKYDRNEQCWPCQWGVVTGIENVQPGRGIEIMPSFVGYQAGEMHGDGTPQHPFDFENYDPDGQFSLYGKYAVKSNLTVEATYNPDFSQVEADAPQIDINTTTALSYPERRPFFQEGSDLFQTIFTPVYTRSINNPQVATKIIGRLNRTTIAYLNAYDELTPIPIVLGESSNFQIGGRSFSNIFRASRAFGSGTNIGVLLTDRRYEGGGSGSVLSTDGNLRMNKNIRLSWQALASQTSEQSLVAPGEDSVVEYFDGGKYTVALDGESYWGHGFASGLTYEDRSLYTDFTYIEKSPTFRMESGFTPENDVRLARLTGLYMIHIDSRLFDWISSQLQVERDWYFTGVKREESATLSFEARFKSQTSTHLEYARGGERFAEEWFGDVWNLHACLSSNFSDMIKFGGNVNYGHTIGRRVNPPTMVGQWSTGGWVDFKPFDRLLLETSLNYTQGERLDTRAEVFDGYTAWSRINMQLSRELSVRLITQYDDFYKRWDIDPLLTYRISPFTMFYVGTTYDYRSMNDCDMDGNTVASSMRLCSRQFFMKLQYLFQV